MKIKLKHLEPNPFRGDYKLDQKIVNSLKCSIRASGFWDNLMAREIVEHKDVFRVRHWQICYGHHRLAALKGLCDESVLDLDFEIEVPIRRLDDSAMVRIMALERSPDFVAGNVNLFDQTVDVVRKYIISMTNETTISAEDVAVFVSQPWERAQVKRAYARLGLNADGTQKLTTGEAI